MKNSVLYLVFVCLFVCICSQKQLYEGDECDLSYNEKGICVRLSLCPSAIEIVQLKQHPKKCGFIRSIPIVCCTKTQVKITRLAEQKCKLLQNKNYEPIIDKPVFASVLPYEEPNVPIDPNNYRGYDSRIYDDKQTPPLQHKPSVLNKRQTYMPFNESYNLEEDKPDKIYHKFVIGGKDAVKREFPHMAALGYVNNKQKLWLCGGSLISEQFVLTAAHCLISKDYGSVQWARLGELNLASSIDQFVAQDYQIIRKIPHPLYQSPSVYHDIALVQLERNIVITTEVKPACLYTLDYIPNNVELLATGWGLTNYGGKQSDILQKVDLELFTENECDISYRSIASTRRLKNGILHKQQICVGSRNEEKDTCQGDSGGPLQIRSNDEDGEKFYIVGVTSFGRACGVPNVPGIYTRVSFYVSWIETIIWPNEK